MARTKLSPPAVPHPKPLVGLKLAFSGKFASIGHTHSSLEAQVKSLGGTVSARVDGNTTHLVCTEDDFNAKTTKVAAAETKGLPIVNSDWLLDCKADDRLVPVDDYYFSSSANAAAPSPPPSAPPGAASTNGSTTARGKKRKADDADGNSQKDAQKQKPTNGQDVNPKEEEEKEVADGQFIKRKDVVIPLDEHCPQADRQVHIDSATGLIYDASLNQTNSGKNNNKFYRIQVSTL